MSLCLVRRESGDIVVPHLKIAATFWSRFRGLQLQKPLAADEGLLIAPCGSVHTHWMRFAIDIVMLNGEGTVLAVRSQVRPWKLCPAPKGTRFVLETLGGTNQLTDGDDLRLSIPEGYSPPLPVAQLVQTEKIP